MISLDLDQRELMRPLFKDDQKNMIRSYLEGHMGRAWINDTVDPTFGLIQLGDFIFINGEISGKDTRAIVNTLNDIKMISAIKRLMKEEVFSPLLVIPGEECVETWIRTHYLYSYEESTRYAIKKVPAFPIERLNSYISQLPEHYQILPIEEDYFYDCLKRPELKDLCSGFQDYEDFRKRGIGFCVCEGDKVVGGASSYVIYDDGIEIEVDTLPDHQRRGVALACGAKLILECLDRGKYPYWDAANLPSVSLAQKLGYELEGEYSIYLFH